MHLWRFNLHKTNAANEELVISLNYGREVQEERRYTNCYLHSNSLSNKMDNSLLAVRDINHKYIVVERGRKMLIVRGIMWISVLIVMLICMVKTKRNGMKKKIRALIFVVFLFILFVFMPYSTEAPIENLFITFKTPEQAIHYINAPFSNDKIEDIIVGQDTCMAVFESGQDEELYAGRDMWLRKGEKGYKLISAAGVQKAILSNDIRDEDLDIFFYVDYIKGTKDTYFTGTCETMGKLTLEDNAGTHFTVRLMDSSFLGTDQKRYYCYGCVKDMQDDYQITVNGKTYTAENIKKSPEFP